MHTSNNLENYKPFDVVFESDNTFEPIMIDGTLFFFVNLIQDCLIKLGIKKVALVKKSDRKDFYMVVRCPYCHATYYQKRISKKYICPSCQKKSSIVTTKGEFSNLLLKRVNNSSVDNMPYKAIDMSSTTK